QNTDHLYTSIPHRIGRHLGERVALISTGQSHQIFRNQVIEAWNGISF
ncbi:hypothetical protein V3C99_003927, partial [Haemonchus contortus]|uniref:Amino acid adenylation n=1 Tax=Haemonchus contortus TaxID=6289 RepID=A0A7I4XXP9_HAECO